MHNKMHNKLMKKCTDEHLKNNKLRLEPSLPKEVPPGHLTLSSPFH